MEFQTILINKHDDVCTITLNRPDVHNALNELMIEELNLALTSLKNEDFRILLLKGNGKSFCSGADLNYMKNMKNFTLEENQKDAFNLAQLMYNLYKFPKITIAIGHGAIMGGGIGLIACCDFSICESETRFSFSEIRLGLIPAVISPYIIRKIGISKAKELFLTGSIFSSYEAEKWGLITKSISQQEIQKFSKEMIQQLLSCPPNTIKEIKELIEINLTYNLEELKIKTSEIIANIRISKEAQEGIQAFFEKRKPYWYKEYEDQ
jgi:methylglutaconyl-CoA hydratase